MARVLQPRERRANAPVFIAIAALALVAFAWAAVESLVNANLRDEVAEAHGNNGNLALAFEQHTLGTLQAVDQAMRLVEIEYAEHGAKLDLPGLARAAQLRGEALAAISVADAAGAVVVSTLEAMPRNLADRAYFEQHRRHNDPALHVSAPVEMRATGRAVIPVSRRLSAPDGSFAGVIVAAVDPRFFSDFYRQMELGSDGMVLLVGLDGATRARRSGGVNTSGQDMLGSTLLREQARRSAGHFVSAGRLDGTSRHTSYRTLGEYGLVVAVGTAAADVAARVAASTMYYRGGAAIFSVLVLAVAGMALGWVIRRRQFLEETLRREARFRAMFDQSAVGIAEVSLDGRFLDVNPALCRIAGYEARELVGRRFLELKRPEDREAAESTRKLFLENAAGSTLERTFVRKDGTLFWATVTPALVRDPRGNPDYFVAMVEDISPRKEAEARVLHQAQFDLLTDLPNRALFHDRLAQALHQARRQGWFAGVLFLDLDKFKQVNDTLGHAAGDALLREVARRLAGSVRAGDTAARLGGDEFAVVLSELAHPEDAARVAEKILNAMQQPMSLEGRPYVLTVSIGIALFPQHGDSGEALLRHADAAMFAAKQAGRNAVRLYHTC